MKRPIAYALILAAVMLSAACGGRSAPVAQDAPAEDGWVMSPMIQAVAPAGSSLSVSGTAAPLGRVVISGPGGQAYAVGADDKGHFDLRVPRPTRDTLFAVEARSGQLNYPAPYRLLVAADPSGPIALLSIGAPTRRLDPGSGLDAVDSDGASAFLSGRAPAGSVVQLDAGGPHTATTGPDGRWVLATASGGDAVRMGAAVYSPVASGGGAEDVLEPAGAGWRIRWSVADGARQTTWFPDRR